MFPEKIAKRKTGRKIKFQDSYHIYHREKQQRYNARKRWLRDHPELKRWIRQPYNGHAGDLVCKSIDPTCSDNDYLDCEVYKEGKWICPLVKGDRGHSKEKADIEGKVEESPVN